MKIALIDGSPKTNNSVSSVLLSDLNHYLIQSKIDIVQIGLHTTIISEEILSQLKSADIWGVAFPLYVDGIPAHLLSCLTQMEHICKNNTKYIYGIVNCGFYEGEQTKPALQILENWCYKAQLNWCGGIGIGGGGSLGMLPDMRAGQGAKAPIDKALECLTKKIMKQQTQKNQYISVGLPRWMYKLCGQIGWRQLIRKNGGKIKDLGRKF